MKLKSTPGILYCGMLMLFLSISVKSFSFPIVSVDVHPNGEGEDTEGKEPESSNKDTTGRNHYESIELDLQKGVLLDTYLPFDVPFTLTGDVPNKVMKIMVVYGPERHFSDFFHEFKDSLKNEHLFHKMGMNKDARKAIKLELENCKTILTSYYSIRNGDYAEFKTSNKEAIEKVGSLKKFIDSLKTEVISLTEENEHYYRKKCNWSKHHEAIDFNVVLDIVEDKMDGLPEKVRRMRKIGVAKWEKPNTYDKLDDRVYLSEQIKLLEAEISDLNSKSKNTAELEKKKLALEKRILAYDNPKFSIGIEPLRPNMNYKFFVKLIYDDSEITEDVEKKLSEILILEHNTQFYNLKNASDEQVKLEMDANFDFERSQALLRRYITNELKIKNFKQFNKTDFYQTPKEVFKGHGELQNLSKVQENSFERNSVEDEINIILEEIRKNKLYLGVLKNGFDTKEYGNLEVIRKVLKMATGPEHVKLQDGRQLFESSISDPGGVLFATTPEMINVLLTNLNSNIEQLYNVKLALSELETGGTELNLLYASEETLKKIKDLKSSLKTLQTQISNKEKDIRVKEIDRNEQIQLIALKQSRKSQYQEDIDRLELDKKAYLKEVNELNEENKSRSTYLKELIEEIDEEIGEIKVTHFATLDSEIAGYEAAKLTFDKELSKLNLDLVEKKRQEAIYTAKIVVLNNGAQQDAASSGTDKGALEKNIDDLVLKYKKNYQLIEKEKWNLVNGERELLMVSRKLLNDLELSNQGTFAGVSTDSYLTRAKYYISADLGMAFLTFKQDQQTTIQPYVGVNFNLFPINKQAHYNLIGTGNSGKFWRNLGRGASFMMGVTTGLNDTELENRKNIISDDVTLINGFALRLSDHARASFGASWTESKKSNDPLVERYKLEPNFFFSLSVDIDVRKHLGHFGTILFGSKTQRETVVQNAFNND